MNNGADPNFALRRNDSSYLIGAQALRLCATTAGGAAASGAATCTILTIVDTVPLFAYAQKAQKLSHCASTS